LRSIGKTWAVVTDVANPVEVVVRLIRGREERAGVETVHDAVAVAIGRRT